MNKKGFLLASETLKIVIAVICIAFLIYFLVNLYFSNANTEKITEAQNNLDRIDDIVLSLEEGESTMQDIVNPEGWHLFSFIEDEKPNSCAGQNCLCICSNSLIQKQEKKCDEDGVCLIVSDLVSDIDIKINGPNDLNVLLIKNQGGKILIGEK